MDSPQISHSVLAARPIRVTAIYNGQILKEEVFQHSPIRIGRLPGNEILLPFDFVSRFHCEIRFENGAWVAVDLGSKNGIQQDGLEPAPIIQLDSDTGFSIQEVSFEISLAGLDEITRDFQPAESNLPEVAQVAPAMPKINLARRSDMPSTKTADARDPHRLATNEIGSSAIPESQSSPPPLQPPSQSQPRRPRPVSIAKKLKARPAPPRISDSLEPAEISASDPQFRALPVLPGQFDIRARLASQKIEGRAKISLQATVLWFDQVLSMHEIAVGAPVIIQYPGARMMLGNVGKKKTTLKEVRGFKAQGSPVVTPEDPLELQKGESLRIYFRYVLRSPALQCEADFVSEPMREPLGISSALHAAAAITVAATILKAQHPRRIEPDRFATFKMTPIKEVVIQPTPTPLPSPKPTPIVLASPVQKPILFVPQRPKQMVTDLSEIVPVKPKTRPARKEQILPPIKKDFSNEKAKSHEVAKVVNRRVVAAATDIDDASELVKKVTLTEPAVRSTPPPVKHTPAPTPVATPVATPVPTPKPTPIPTPIPFDARSVGALKTLSALSAGPDTDASDLGDIKISHAQQATETGKAAGTQTGTVMNQLQRSSRSFSGDLSGSGRAHDSSSDDSTPRKGRAAGYQTSGLTGRAGTAAIRGTVVGGATYKELGPNEGLTKDQVLSVVQASQIDIQNCYQNALKKNPGLQGQADFEWRISPHGAVEYVKVLSTTLQGASSMLACVQSVFSNMTFPAATNQNSTTSTIGLPFKQDHQDSD